jgi:methylase of polypeptide subunit release factors
VRQNDAGPGQQPGARSRPSPPPAADAAAVDALRADVEAWTVDAVHELLGPVAQAAMAREEAVPALRALRDQLDEPLAALTAVFVLGRPIARRRLAGALPRLGVDGAGRLGLVEAAGEGMDDEVRALVDLRPYAAQDAGGTAHWWVASDLGELATGRPLGPDPVLGVGGASVTLARCTVRTPVGRVLDVGTGCGVQALHAGRHAGAVVATDLSGRALAFARLNLALNGVRADLRQGDLLEPTRGELFDLVVSNPPFVITPRTPAAPAYTYRDAGLAGDEVVSRLVTGVREVLRPGGVAQLLGNWEDRDGEPWAERVGAWIEESGLDGWVVQRELQDPAQYAELWMRDGGDPEPARRAALYEAWLDDFAARKVEGIGFGLVTLRRPAEGGRPTLHRVEDLLGPLEEPVGEHIAACLAAHDWLTAHDDDALLTARLQVAADVTEERHHRPGEEDPAVILLRQGGGFRRVVRASTALAGLVGACDGELPIGAITAALADLLDEPLGELTGRLLPAVRGLVADGLLTPTAISG